MYTANQKPLVSNMFKVGRRNFAEERVLGKGTFGKVYKVREDGRPGSVYALKKIEVENNQTENMVKKEIDILAKCSHAHIVSLCEVDVKMISGSIFVLILMEYCEGGNLNSRLARPSDSETNLRWMKESADVMCYMHSNMIVHRDLKPENVLLTANDSIKVGDFGLAREYANLKQGGAMRPDQAFASYPKEVYMGTVAGSPYWMAPEVFDGHYTEKADIFSLGTIFYAILTRESISAWGKTCYGAFVSVGGQRIGLGMAMRSNPNVMVPLDGLPHSTRELLHSMLAYDPRNRPSAREVLGKIGSILYLDDSSSPNPQLAYPTVNIQPYPHNPFPQPAPSPIPNFIPPSPSPSEQSPLPNQPYLQAGPPFQYYPYPQVPPPPPVVAPPLFQCSQPPTTAWYFPYGYRWTYSSQPNSNIHWSPWPAPIQYA